MLLILTLSVALVYAAQRAFRSRRMPAEAHAERRLIALQQTSDELSEIIRKNDRRLAMLRKVISARNAVRTASGSDQIRRAA